MLNKFLFLIILIVISDCVIAQHVYLQKNNSNQTLKIKLPKKVAVKYLIDSTIQDIEANAIAYNFPNLIITLENDTFSLKVQKILSINYSPTLALGYYVLMFPVTLFGCAFTGVAIVDPKESGIVVPFIMGASLLCYDYFLFTHANRKLNTEDIWSFY